MKRITIISMIIVMSMLLPSNALIHNTQIAVSPDAEIKLVIATRHDSIIYNKFAAEFVKSSYGQAAGITDPASIKFYAPTTYEGFYKTLTNSFFQADIGWGGGPTLFNGLVQDGAVSPITNATTLAVINDAVNDTLAGAQMKSYVNGSLMWAANAISSFGFTVNHKELEKRGLPMPKTWTDLASPDFFTSTSEANVGLGNAPDTTSNTRIYQIIFQKYGWERGWEIINGMAGNGQIYRGSVETRQSVISGETAVAMTIDFYGIIAQNENPDTEYVVPENASIVNGDPMVLAKNPAHPDAAQEFMKFAFSKEGQSLWLDPAINRLPIRADAFDTALGATRPDIKALYEKTLNNQGIQFNETLSSSIEEAMRYYWEASITDVHDNLKATWGRIMNGWKQNAFSENRYNELIQAFGKPAISMDEIAKIDPQIRTDPEFRTQKTAEWSAYANDKFAAVDALRTEPETFTSTDTQTLTTVITSTYETTITTTGTDGKDTVLTSTVTSLITSTITSEIVTSVTSSVSSVSNTVKNIPFAFTFSVFAMASIALLLRKRNK